ncbi:MAG: response regulator [Gammaproteobacteria bacterium]|nr:response regulator [Gammaproteobacteria bacterium]
MKILIVDDNIDLASGLYEILSIENHDVSIYDNAEEALHACTTKRFDIGFLDVKLPGMNGVNLFKEIKTLSPDTKLFIISGYRMTQIIEECSGINNIGILSEHTNNEDIVNYISNIDNTPISLTVSSSECFPVWLSKQLSDQKIKSLISRFDQLHMYNTNNYDVLIIETDKPLIYALIDFIDFRKSGNKTPIVLVSRNFINRLEPNKLHSLEFTGCLFKPFKPEDIISIVDNITHNNRFDMDNFDSTIQTNTIQ